MNKRYVMIWCLVWMMVSSVLAQSYDKLWSQAASMRKKDLPRSEIAILQTIADKATEHKDYGQLLAAELRQASLWNDISVDSLASVIDRMEQKFSQHNDPLLQSVWYAALGKMYKGMQYRNGLYQTKSKACFEKALEHLDLLAQHTSTEYAPLTLKGVDGASFHHDMLHLIGFEANTQKTYRMLATYYNKVGNKGAACLCDAQMVEKVSEIDSLLQVYQDLPEAGELAVKRYRLMDCDEKVSAKDKLDYIEYALAKWGKWTGMSVLRNAKKTLIEPMFSIDALPVVMRPSQSVWGKLKVRHLQQVKITLSPVSITADNDYDINDKDTYKLLAAKRIVSQQRVFTKSFVGNPDYEEVTDSFKLADLPLGAYMMEVSSDNTDVPVQRALFYVSDLALMAQQLPDDSHRYVVVSATTGQPIAGARILLYDMRYDGKTGKDKRIVHARLTTDKNGEVSFKNVDGSIFVSTATDQFTPAQYVYLSRTRYYERKESKVQANVFTDRAIYRPGQTVHVSMVAFVNDRGLDASVWADKETKMVLKDAHWKVVAEKQVHTDEYGTASTDFIIPQGSMAGQYRVEVPDVHSSGYFRVEEYKRPTFEVAFPKVKEQYAWGDTVVVRGSAKTFAGVPVQGAKVRYEVIRRQPLWWWGGRTTDKMVFNGTATTREDGGFDVNIPLVADVAVNDNQGMEQFMRTTRFFRFDVKAVVTDMSGESHEGTMNLPLGTKTTAFGCDLPKRMEVDSLHCVIFSYRNASGVEIEGEVSYRIDGGTWSRTIANKVTVMPKLTSGQHLLEAICGKDSLQHTFTLFKVTDTRPMEKTVHWSYQTAKVFSRDGKPVYVQVGSSEKDVYVVYSIIAGNRLLAKGAWQLSDSIVTLPFTYQADYVSGIVINYCFVKNGVRYGDRLVIERPLPDKRLNVAWKTFRNRLAPGQKEEWTLKITTPDGKPAKAQLMSVLYDKSLDQLLKNNWQCPLGFFQVLPNCIWKSNLDIWKRTLWLMGAYPTQYDKEKSFEVDRFDDMYFRHYSGNKVFYAMESTALSDITVETFRSRRSPVMNKMAVMKHEFVKPEMAEGVGMAAPPMEVDGDINVDGDLDNVSLRENMGETAFFYPALLTDENGNVSLRFTLPETITTWKFMGLAHDKEMRNGILVDEAVAQKTVMVQPNLPRFLREGDKAVLAAKIFNTSDKAQDGTMRMQLIDPATDKEVWENKQQYHVDAKGTITAQASLPSMSEGIYIYKVVVVGNSYSDGEQHYLPVLSSRELVTNTLPLTLTEKGENLYDLSSLFVGKEGKRIKNVGDAKVTIEYANNPAWLMIQALPSISNPVNDDNAISLMSAIYSNGIARHIMQQSPVVKQVVELWRKEDEQHKENSLMSNLEKNSELKSLVLEETPWLLDADKESEQKRLLINYFDESMLNQRLASQVENLRKLQNTDGSFSWWKGMTGSRYMTTEVAKMMVRLNGMVGMQAETVSMLNAAMGYLQTEAAKEVRMMKDEERKNHPQLRPSETAIDYLYILALDGRKLSGTAMSDKNYLLRKMADKTQEFTIYGKAQAAVVLAKNNERQKAMDYLHSIQEYAVSKSDMGCYFDTRKAYYSWSDYKIPTQVAAIEAMQLLGEQATEYQRWLLQAKRTQSWTTPVNAVNAVYAFMKGNDKVLATTSENVRMKLDGKELSLPKSTVGLGYVKIAKMGTASQLIIDKKNEEMSWGAIYAQFTMPSKEIASSVSGIKIERIIPRKVKVGDKVKVVLTITADRDYDFVQVVDKRAACLEPVMQISGYHSEQGCYISPKDDTTNLYFNRLSKGKHIVELEYFVDRKGSYLSGTCSVQCAYSPEFGGRTEGDLLEINN